MVGRQSAIAIFFVRAWQEDDQFRARVTRCLDLRSEHREEFLTADPEELVDYLRTWLREMDQQPEAL